VEDEGGEEVVDEVGDEPVNFMEEYLFLAIDKRFLAILYISDLGWLYIIALLKVRSTSDMRASGVEYARLSSFF